MKRILAIGCLTVLALIVMDTTQTPSGLTMKRGQALAADMPLPPPMAPAAPVGKGKAPIGKGKGPIVTRG